MWEFLFGKRNFQPVYKGRTNALLKDVKRRIRNNKFESYLLKTGWEDKGSGVWVSINYPNLVLDFRYNVIRIFTKDTSKYLDQIYKSNIMVDELEDFLAIYKSVTVEVGVN